MTQDFRQQAEQIVRSQEELCYGIDEPLTPYCSCAPDSFPLCPACEKLVDAIASALAGAATEWQPIQQLGESRDYVLLVSPAHGRVIGAHVTGDVWHLVGIGAVSSESERPTYFMPLPAVPLSVAPLVAPKISESEGASHE